MSHPRRPYVRGEHGPPPLAPPEAFGIVEPKVYRSNVIVSTNFAFLKTLHLKKIVDLSAETSTRAMMDFCERSDIEVANLGRTAWREEASWKPLSEEVVKETLEIILDRNNHPVLIICSTGVYQTGAVVACLRRLQKWNMTAIREEYRNYSGETRTRFMFEQFIELFDVDLVCLPQQLPDWFMEQQRMFEEEEKDFYALWKDQRIDPATYEVKIFGLSGFQRWYYSTCGPLVSELVVFSEKSIIEDDND